MFGIDDILGAGLKILDKVIPDPAQAADAKLKLLQLQQSGELAVMTSQTEINKVEAGNGSVFVSGWRPACGWICALALGYQYLIRPLGSVVGALFGVTVPNMPGLDDNLWQLLMGMLGMGGLRTYEKISGVASK